MRLQDRLSFALSLLLLICAAPLAAGPNTWTSAGPHGGSTETLARAPSAPRTLYAGTEDAGIWVSADNGSSWSLASDFGYGRILLLAVHPNDPRTVVASVAELGLVKSTNGGRTWETLNRNIEPFQPGGVLFDPRAPDTLWATGGGVRRSRDGGRTWEALGLGNLQPRSLALDTTLPGTAYVATQQDGVWKTTDDGATWQAVNDGLPVTYERIQTVGLATDPNEPSTIYVAISEGGLWKSTDGAATWQPTGLMDYIGLTEIRIVPGDSATVYVIDNFGGLQRSRDAGTSFERVLSGARGASMLVDPRDPSTLHAAFRGDPEGAFGGGVWRSNNAGETWVHNGVPNTRIRLLEVDPAHPDTVFAAARSGIFRSDDGGLSWRQLTGRSVVENPEIGAPSLLSVDALELDPNAPETLYAANADAFDYYREAALWRSRDGGATWNEIAPVEERIFAIAIDPDDSTHLYALAQANDFRDPPRLLESRDDAANWAEIAVPAPHRLDDLVLDPRDPRRLYAFGLGIATSLDGGVSWSVASPGLPEDAQVADLEVDPVLPQTLWAALRTGVYRSSDHGASWELRGERAVADLEVAPTGELYASDSEGVSVSRDGGLTWSPVGTAFIHPANPLVFVPEDRDAERPARLYAGTIGSGVAVLDLAGCTPDDTTLCIDDAPGDRRFEVRLRFSTTLGDGAEGEAMATSLAPSGFDDGGILAFFSPSNPEVLVKILDGCAQNGHYWVFAAAATSVGYELRVRDTATGLEQTYINPDRNPAATITDGRAFPTCGVEAVSSVPMPPSLPAAALDRPAGPPPPVDACTPDAVTLCIDNTPGDGRFRVRLRFETALGDGGMGDAMATPLAPLGFDDGGILAFFSPSNPEVLVKVLDGCRQNGHFWVFAAAATRVGYTLTVEDVVTGDIQRYVNPDGNPAATLTDIRAFATCDG